MLRNKDNNMKRNVCCILGLPFDVVTMSGAIDILYHSVKNESSCFISTPNLNFLIESQSDIGFRKSVINSDLSVVDGKPLVWLSRLLKIPVSERVAGADLVEELIENKARYKPLNVFFFGGEQGVSEIACEKLKNDVSGLKCVGNLNPGFGSIEDMSSDEIINKINKSGADFIIVSLGAKKGQTWIEKNRKKINAPAISHLGAVVNFIAGTVNRSPKIMQKIGLEWLWRIKEEPLLWKRYFNDALSFAGLLIFRALPLFLLNHIFKKNKENKSRLKIYNSSNLVNVELSGYWGSENIAEINQKFESILNSYTEEVIEVVFKKDAYIDSALMAKILLFNNMLCNDNRTLIIKTESKLMAKIFRYNCCEYLLHK